MQLPLAQSATTLHELVRPQGPQASPPQSTPVSWPFCSWSLQVGAAHLPLVQRLLRQSESSVQPSDGAHGGHCPPQSRSVSVPFCRWSLQPGAVHLPLTQILLAQSVALPQAWPAAQLLQPGPQSRSLSLPFLTPSSQLGG